MSESLLDMKGTSCPIPVLRANPGLAPVGQAQVPLKLAAGVSAADLHWDLIF